MSQVIENDDPGLVTVRIGGKEFEVEVLDDVDEQEQHLAPLRDSDGNIRPEHENDWTAAIAAHIEKKFGVKVSKLAAGRYREQMVQARERVIDFFCLKPVSPVDSGLTPDGSLPASEPECSPL